jgi:hypothetical protein
MPGSPFQTGLAVCLPVKAVHALPYSRLCPVAALPCCRLGGWQPVEKPVFDVQHLKTRLKGNNVPMPDALIKTILRIAIPGLIQRKLLGVVPRELGSYLLAGIQKGFLWCVCGELHGHNKNRQPAGRKRKQKQHGRWVPFIL